MVSAIFGAPKKKKKSTFMMRMQTVHEEDVGECEDAMKMDADGIEGLNVLKDRFTGETVKIEAHGGKQWKTSMPVASFFFVMSTGTRYPR
jgi:hypothetical protein